ncbi:MAG: cell wall hydrolase [Alphaproteobacteria bacterium]|nr:cell wall hydrolase [Alphaproteobacteria bacterium]
MPVQSAVAQAQHAPAPDAQQPAIIRLQDMSPDQARLWNASVPIAKGPNPAARPFHLETEGVLDEARAIDCMTAAIYYEAGFESIEGQRAVAQVVLNRLHHPAFPKTVCGVVFQGSDRSTGCQFTFTCDGALGRKPDEAAWDRARKVAIAALNGYVMKRVGMATHYHADYVAPYWSPDLVKVAVVGHHIFYRWTGGWGTPPAFVGRYAGGEMTGLQVATLDNLAKASPKATLADLTTEVAAPPAATPETEPAAPAAKPAAVAEPAHLITAAQEATNASAIIKPEDLDWQGRPRDRDQPPRIAIPQPMPGPGRTPF